MSALVEIWKRTAPNHALHRFAQTLQSLNSLTGRERIPLDPQVTIDVGYGSGGGTIALKEKFPKAQVVAVDNFSTHQWHRDYRPHPLPRWTAIDDYEVDIREVASNLPKADLVVASRMPILYNDKEGWREFCAEGATIILALARCVAENGTLIIGYDPAQETGISTINEVYKCFCWKELFQTGHREVVPEDNTWLVFTRPNQNVGNLSPYDALSEYGALEKDPHFYFRYDDD